MSSGKRRDKGDGSLFFRVGEQRWIARFKGTDGKEHTISVSVGSLTRAEAKKKAKLRLEEAKLRLEETTPTSQTVEEYLTSWLKEKSRTLKRNTAANWKKFVATYIIPLLGKYRLDELTKKVVKEWVGELCGDEWDLEASSIHTFFEILDLALKEAVDHGILQRNPCYKVALPRVEEREMQVLDADQSKAFLAHLAKEGHTHEAFFLLAIYTGMRSGEIRALKWTDLDLDKKEARIRRSVCYIKYEGFFENEPKTKNSRRTIILSDEVVEALRAHHKRQLLHIGCRYRKTVGWEDKNLVFPGPSGNYMHEATPGQSLKRVLVRAGLPVIRVHDLRHTYATLALKAGVNIKSVSLTLGHSDILVTMRRYIHILPDMRQEDIRKLSKLLA